MAPKKDQASPGGKEAKGKKVKAAKQDKAFAQNVEGGENDTKEQLFCRSITAECKEEHVSELIGHILSGAGLSNPEDLEEGVEPVKKDLVLLTLGLMAVRRICDIEAPAAPTFFVLSCNGMETIAYLAKGNGPQKTQKNAELALNAICLRVAAWLDDVDPLDFMELPKVIELGREYGHYDIGIALSFLACLERFATHRSENALAMLEEDVLKIIHLLLAAHRAPEFVDEVFVALYRICDFPGNHIAEPLAAEIELVQTVVEAMQQAPLNMRMQVNGFRLLCLWNQPEIFPEGMEFFEKEEITKNKDDVRVAMRQSGVPKELEKAFDVLSRSGLTHQASWIKIIGANTLMPDRLGKRVHQLPRDNPI